MRGGNMLSNFFFGSTQFTVLEGQDGQKWLVARELCGYLRLKNITVFVKKLPADCKQRVVIEEFKSKGKGRGGDNGVRIIVNREGAVRLISASTREEAERFKKWLFGEVFGEIEKNGVYIHKRQIEAPQPDPEQKQLFQDPTGILPSFDHAPVNYGEACQHLADFFVAGKELVTQNVGQQRQLVIAEKTINQASAKIIKMEPKVEAFDQCHNATGNISLRDCANTINVPSHTLTAQAVEAEILYYNGRGVLCAYAKYLRMGWFATKSISREWTKTLFIQTMVTPKGQHMLWKLFGREKKGE
jgi:prophage antirepressor-like protein/phage antirepressor YoqD-like protein